ncbi:MAG: DUF4124 domain-containing protein, partial [Solirubrobacterales bacterium]|nr:DUF4124 domain-containing protein [Solirubrobacterales bacterium]
TSFWNTPLPADAPLHASSAGYVAELGRQLGFAVPWINTTQYSTPVYTVPADAPTVRVALDVNVPELQQALEAVPIPAGAAAARGTDQHLTVWQPATDTMWELWLARRGLDGRWRARWGGRMTGVSTNPGHFTQKDWGATATGLPLLGGLIRTKELEVGRIDHALAFAIPDALAGQFVWPAQRTDGNRWDAGSIPEGTRFRIDPNLDLATVSMPASVRAIAVAAQRYGIVLRDRAGAVTFYAEDSTPNGPNPYFGLGALFGTDDLSQQLRTFPWSHLQALR